MMEDFSDDDIRVFQSRGPGQARVLRVRQLGGRLASAAVVSLRELLLQIARAICIWKTVWVGVVVLQTAVGEVAGRLISKGGKERPVLCGRWRSLREWGGTVKGDSGKRSFRKEL